MSPNVNHPTAPPIAPAASASSADSSGSHRLAISSSSALSACTQLSASTTTNSATTLSPVVAPCQASTVAPLAPGPTLPKAVGYMAHSAANGLYPRITSTVTPQPAIATSASTAHLANPKGESKRCNCRKSRCLKLYCECFAANVFCKGCKCADCRNLPEHQADRLKAIEYKLSRRPRAFDPKFTPATASSAPTGTEPLRHSRGCNCKKSGCEKKYCECFQNGVSCTSVCKCTQCRNDGSIPHLRNFGVVEWRTAAMGRAAFELAAMSRPAHPADFIPGLEPSFTFVPYHVAQQKARDKSFQETKSCADDRSPSLNREPKTYPRRKRGASDDSAVKLSAKRTRREHRKAPPQLKHHRTNSGSSFSSMWAEEGDELLDLDMYPEILEVASAAPHDGQMDPMPSVESLPCMDDLALSTEPISSALQIGSIASWEDSAGSEVVPSELPSELSDRLGSTDTLSMDTLQGMDGIDGIDEVAGPLMTVPDTLQARTVDSLLPHDGADPHWGAHPVANKRGFSSHDDLLNSNGRGLNHLNDNTLNDLNALGSLGTQALDTVEWPEDNVESLLTGF